MTGSQSAPVKYTKGKLRADTRKIGNQIAALEGQQSAYLKVAGGQEIQGGFTIAEVDLGAPANGATVIVDPSDGQKQKITNNVAGFTISATEECGDVELRIINGPSAGTITWDGFNIEYPGGAVLDTVDGNQFVAFIFGFGEAGADYILQARQ